MIILLSVRALLAGFLAGLIRLTHMKSFLDLEKLSPFECGFIPKNNSRFHFSLQFFLITLIFLIFDVELVLLFPYLALLPTEGPIIRVICLTLFVFFLALGLFWEWAQAILE